MLASAPIISSPDGRLLVDTVRQDPDGLWRPIRIPGQRYRFHPYNGEWGWLAWEEAGQGWFVARMDLNGPGEPIPLPPGVEKRLAVAPDGELRAGMRRVRPDGTILRSPLGWIPGAIPGPDGSWLTEDGIQLIPAGDGLCRVVPWRPQGDGLAFRFLWIGEAVLAFREGRLIRIAHPGAAPEVLADGIPEDQQERAPICRVFPDGRWIAQRKDGKILLGDPEGVRAELSLPNDIEVPEAMPLHDGFWAMGRRAFWLRPDGLIRELPPICTFGGRDVGGWRIRPGLRTPYSQWPALAVFRGGSPIYELPPLKTILPGWAQAESGALWHFPEDGSPPRQIPLPRDLSRKASLVGTAGRYALVIGRSGEGDFRLAALAPDRSWKVWPIPRVDHRVLGWDLGDGSLLVHLTGWLGRLFPDRAVWIGGPDAPLSVPSGSEIQPAGDGWLLGLDREICLIPRGAPILLRVRPI